MLYVIKKTIIYWSLLILIGCNGYDQYKADKYFSKDQKDSLLVKTLPYIAKLPYGATWETRNEDKFHAHYVKILPFFSLQNCYKTKDSVYYYLIWKQAPSIEAKEKIAIGGSFKLDANKKMIAFDEVFHTPKMTVEKLTEIGNKLFDELVTTGNVEKYAASPEIIEFPNQQFIYEKSTNKWVARNR